MFGKESAKVSAGHAKPVGEVFYVTIVEGATGDKLQASAHGGRRSAPGRCAGRALGSASQAWPESGLACGGGTGVEGYVFAFGRYGRTNWTAVDAGRQYTDEELAVESRISRNPRSLTDFLAVHR